MLNHSPFFFLCRYSYYTHGYKNRVSTKLGGVGVFKMNKNINEKWYLDFIMYMSKKYNDEAIVELFGTNYKYAVCIVNGVMHIECGVYEYQSGGKTVSDTPSGRVVRDEVGTKTFKYGVHILTESVSKVKEVMSKCVAKTSDTKYSGYMGNHNCILGDRSLMERDLQVYVDFVLKKRWSANVLKDKRDEDIMSFGAYYKPYIMDFIPKAPSCIKLYTGNTGGAESRFDSDSTFCMVEFSPTLMLFCHFVSYRGINENRSGAINSMVLRGKRVTDLLGSNYMSLDKEEKLKILCALSVKVRAKYAKDIEVGKSVELTDKEIASRVTKLLKGYKEDGDEVSRMGSIGFVLNADTEKLIIVKSAIVNGELKDDVRNFYSSNFYKFLTIVGFDFLSKSTETKCKMVDKFLAKDFSATQLMRKYMYEFEHSDVHKVNYSGNYGYVLEAVGAKKDIVMTIVTVVKDSEDKNKLIKVSTLGMQDILAYMGKKFFDLKENTQLVKVKNFVDIKYKKDAV